MYSYYYLSNFATQRWFLSLNCKLGKTIFIYVYLELRYQFYCRKHSRHWSNLMQWVVARPVVFSVKLFYASMGIRFIVIYVAYPLRFDWALRRSAKLVLDATVWTAIKYELQYLHIWIESTVTISCTSRLFLIERIYDCLVQRGKMALKSHLQKLQG